MTSLHSRASANSRRSRALPGGRLPAERQQLDGRAYGRLLTRLKHASDLKEGAHGGTRGFPVPIEEVPAR
jgi:hypothetical protein